MNLPPFPEGFLPRSPEERLMLVQWGEQCRAMYKEDAERLDWLMLHVSGRELRRLNVWTSAGCDRAAIDTARGADRQRARAPWTDFAGNPIHDGDTIRHPGGEVGRVVYQPGGETEGDRWRVDYGTGALSRLGLQIGDKGRAVVVDAARIDEGRWE